MTVDTEATLQEDLRRLAEQEHLLRLDRFGPSEAWALGNVLREMALARGAPLTIDGVVQSRATFRTRSLFASAASAPLSVTRSQHRLNHAQAGHTTAIASVVRFLSSPLAP